MEPAISLSLLSLLFFVAMGAGVVDSIAGGGGMITIPVLLSIGLSPAQALATNKLQAVGGSFSASFYFISRKMVNLQAMKVPIAMAFLGSIAGTLLVQNMDASLLNYVIPWMLIAIALYFLFSPSRKGEKGNAKISLLMFSLTAVFSIGFYDGFMGAGTGSLYAMAFTGLMGYTLPEATAHTKVLNCTSNIASLLFFILGGHTVWAVGFIMLAGELVGARMGAKLVFNRGAKIIRPLIIIISLVMAAKLLWQGYMGV
ncbi:hypothetical protein CI610_00045 [invertebrate metagenome]|uniref:Membrane transporter protein n=1 Tax=invertebrate metagenome TaxID=1711999 RepID=A0A2H9TCL0_9ZZZZ